MNRHDFDILLQKYLNGACDKEEMEQVERWSEKMLRSSPVALGKAEARSVRSKIWKRLRASSLDEGAWWSGWGRMGMAAAVLVIVLSGMYLTRTHYSNSALYRAFEGRERSEVGLDSEVSDFITIASTGEGRAHVLEDGTRVVLEKNSRLRYPIRFGEKQRKVELIGAAFFEVKRDVTRPFLVLTDDLVTQVLGTSFKVSSYENSGSIVVSVVTGRVSVYENAQKGANQRNGVILTPNQQITFDKASGKIVAELVKEPLLVNPVAEQSFVFKEVPLLDVLKAVQHAFDVEIVLESPVLESCIFTGDLNDLSLHTQLQFICSAVNGTYELRGTTFFIRGEGCP